MPLGTRIIDINKVIYCSEIAERRRQVLAGLPIPDVCKNWVSITDSGITIARPTNSSNQVYIDNWALSEYATMSEVNEDQASKISIEQGQRYIRAIELQMINVFFRNCGLLEKAQDTDAKRKQKIDTQLKILRDVLGLTKDRYYVSLPAKAGDQERTYEILCIGPLGEGHQKSSYGVIREVGNTGETMFLRGRGM